MNKECKHGAKIRNPFTFNQPTASTFASVCSQAALWAKVPLAFFLSFMADGEYKEKP